MMTVMNKVSGVCLEGVRIGDVKLNLVEGGGDNPD